MALFHDGPAARVAPAASAPPVATSPPRVTLTEFALRPASLTAAKGMFGMVTALVVT